MAFRFLAVDFEAFMARASTPVTPGIIQVSDDDVEDVPSHASEADAAHVGFKLTATTATPEGRVTLDEPVLRTKKARKERRRELKKQKKARKPIDLLANTPPKRRNVASTLTSCSEDERSSRDGCCCVVGY